MGQRSDIPGVTPAWRTPSLGQVLRTGLWYRFHRINYTVTGDWTWWLSMRRELKPMTVVQVKACLAHIQRRLSEQPMRWIHRHDPSSWCFFLMGPLVLLSTWRSMLRIDLIIIGLLIASVLLSAIRRIIIDGDVWLRLVRFARAYVADEPFRVPICLQCGYDLTGAVADHCPECGVTRLLKLPAIK